MNNRECLFIGGVADGKRQCIDDGARFFEVPVIPPMEFSTDPLEIPEITYNRQAYTREIVRWNRGGGLPPKEYHLFLPDGFPKDNLMDVLINSYRKG